MDKGAAKYGCTFDAHGWRSLAPITHSISTKCYYKLEGDKTGFQLYDFTSEPAFQALEIMKKMLDLSSANALQPGSTDGGVNQTPDEVAFAAELVPYYIKYQNAPLRFAEKWKDPTQFRMGALPKAKGGEGGTAFWDTGASPVQVRQEQGEGRRVPEGAHLRDADLEGLDRGQLVRPSGAIAALQVHLRWLESDTPDWLAKESWVPLVRGGLDNAKAIPNHQFGLTQFQIGQPIWEKYLKGEEKDRQEGDAGVQGRRRGRDQEGRLLRHLRSGDYHSGDSKWLQPFGAACADGI